MVSEPSRHRRNRVTPFGEIEATSARGTLMGNRGILHDAQGHIGSRRWTHRAWVTCELSFQGIRRTIAAPGNYTELFFADEAVALAAGHRPCWTCRRRNHERFVQAWRNGHAMASDAPLLSKDIDVAMHAARVAGGSQIRTDAFIRDLPDGVFVTLADTPEQPMLLWHGGLHRWTHEGDHPPQIVASDAPVRVLTPSATVKVLNAGYEPDVAITATVQAEDMPS